MSGQRRNDSRQEIVQVDVDQLDSAPDSESTAITTVSSLASLRRISDGNKNRRIYPQLPTSSGSLPEQSNNQPLQHHGSSGSAGGFYQNNVMSSSGSVKDFYHNDRNANHIMTNGFTIEHNNQDTRPVTFELEWRALCFTVTPDFYEFGKKPTQLLNSINGHIESGEFIALMGPSGCGKTTLMDCLAGRRSECITSGGIFIRGKGAKQIRVALVPQYDSFFGLFTVRETLIYAVRLKCHELSTAKQSKLVSDVLTKLGLDMCAAVRVANCSGGQKKRLSIAQELLSRPNILLLDEPVSGLDSTSCLTTLTLLSHLAHSSISAEPEAANKVVDPLVVVASIHQPSMRLLELFDKIYFMGYHGLSIYEGNVMGIDRKLDDIHFNSVNGHHANPTDALMEVASLEHGPEAISKLYESHCSSYHGDLTETQSTIDQDIAVWVPLNKVLLKPRYPFFYHTYVLTGRALKAKALDPGLMLLMVLGHILIPVMLGILFSREVGSADGCPRPSMLTISYEEMVSWTINSKAILDEVMLIMKNCGFMYSTILLSSIMTLGLTVLTFPLECEIFTKEHKNGWYSLGCYYLGRSLAEIAIQLVYVMIYNTVSFYTTGQVWEPFRFFMMMSVVILSNLFAQAISQIVGAIFLKNIVAGVFMSATVALPLAIFNSFFVRLATAEWYVRAIAYLSFFHYSYESLVVAIYGFGRCQCPETNGTTVKKPAWVQRVIPIFDSLLNEENVKVLRSNARDMGTELITVQDDDNLYEDELESGDNATTGLSAFEVYMKNLELNFFHWTSNCSEYKPVPMAIYQVDQSDFLPSISILIAMVLSMRIFTYMVLLKRCS